MAEASKEPKRIGTVIHYYSQPHVAVIKCDDDVLLGAHVRFAGATTDFEEDIDSMEYDHHKIVSAHQGQEVGVKVKERVREGDRVYAIS